MNEKYSKENVDKALLPWARHKDVLAEKESITSRLESGTTETSIFLKKKYHLYNIPLLPSHFFLLVDGKEFHPGSSETPIFVNASDPSESYTLSMEEKCHHCAYYELKKYFDADKDYSLGFNNCQNVLGEHLETCLLWAAVTATVCYISIGEIIFVVVAVFLATFVILLENFRNSKSKFEYMACPHIRRVV